MKTKELFTKPEQFQSTCLSFYITAPYRKMVDIFGLPNDVGDPYKTDVEWSLMTKSGIYFTIYNYKDGKNYRGEQGLNKTDISRWHIGMRFGEEYETEQGELKSLFFNLGLQ